MAALSACGNAVWVSVAEHPHRLASPGRDPRCLTAIHTLSTQYDYKEGHASMTSAPTAAPKTVATRSVRSRKNIVEPLATSRVPAMAISVLQEHLKRALAKALHAVASKSTLPVL